MAERVNTDYATNLPWNGWKNGHNEWLITLLESGVAKDLTDYTFRLDIYANHEGSINPRLSLTQGSGLTNGTTAGTIRNILTQTQSGTTLPGNDYYYILSYTINSKTFALYKGTLTLGARNNPASPTSSTSANVTMVGADGSFTAVTANVTLAGSSLDEDDFVKNSDTTTLSGDTSIIPDVEGSHVFEIGSQNGGTPKRISTFILAAKDSIIISSESDGSFNFQNDSFTVLGGSFNSSIKINGPSSLTPGIQLKTGTGSPVGGTVRLSINESGVITFPSLPTSDPGVVDALWNDAGTLKISAG